MKENDSGFRTETLTISEIKDILRSGYNATYNLIHSNAFPVLKIGHSYRIPTNTFYQWFNQTHTDDIKGAKR